MYGMTREEAAEKALLYERLVADVRKLALYVESTVGRDNAVEILRPVQWVLKQEEPHAR